MSTVVEKEKKIVARIKITNNGKANSPECFDYNHLHQNKISYLNHEHGYSKTKQIRKRTKNKTKCSPPDGLGKKMYIHMYI